MDTYQQAHRPIALTTPLERDTLLLIGFSGQEGISELFSYELEMLARNKAQVPFDKLLGQSVTVQVTLPNGRFRYFNGICSRLSQLGRDEVFTSYRMEMVSRLWLLTRKARSRIFQRVTVPDIIKTLLEGIEIDLEVIGTWEPRDYCVQY